MVTDILEMTAQLLGGIGTVNNKPVTVIAQVKGHNTKENISRNFGMPSPEGYRKALRLMKEAEKFHRPIICFVDTPGAFCGLEAEERGQGEAIARNLFEMSAIKVPILSIFVGEGEVAAPWPWQLPMKFGCWKIQCIRFCLLKAMQVFFGKMEKKLTKRQKP